MSNNYYNNILFSSLLFNAFSASEYEFETPFNNKAASFSMSL